MNDDDIRRDLDAWLTEGLSDPDDGRGEDLVPPADVDQASRYLRAVARLDADEAKLTAVVEGELARLRAFLEDRLAGVRARRAYLERLLEGFTRGAHVASGGRQVTWKLPHGELKLRPVQDRVVVDEPERFVEWASASGLADRLVRVKEEPVLGEAKRVLVPGPTVLSVSSDGIEVRAALYVDPDELLAAQMRATTKAAEEGTEPPSADDLLLSVAEVVPGASVLVTPARRFSVTLPKPKPAPDPWEHDLAGLDAPGAEPPDEPVPTDPFE